MTTPAISSIEGIDLSVNEFWALPLTERQEAFARLRAVGRPVHVDEPENPFGSPRTGYYAFVSPAALSAASRNCSPPGAARPASSTCRPSGTSTSAP